jgi:hypothetical protein
MAPTHPAFYRWAQSLELTSLLAASCTPPPPGHAELYVWEDDIARTIRFTNARSDGFMSKFDGTWHVQPFTQQTLDSIYKGGAAAAAAGQQPWQEKGHNWLGSKQGGSRGCGWLEWVFSILQGQGCQALGW